MTFSPDNQWTVSPDGFLSLADCRSCGEFMWKHDGPYNYDSLTAYCRICVKVYCGPCFYAGKSCKHLEEKRRTEFL